MLEKMIFILSITFSHEYYDPRDKVCNWITMPGNKICPNKDVVWCLLVNYLNCVLDKVKYEVTVFAYKRKKKKNEVTIAVN
jgi:hypothetical protein